MQAGPEGTKMRFSVRNETHIVIEASNNIIKSNYNSNVASGTASSPKNGGEVEDLGEWDMVDAQVLILIYYALFHAFFFLK